MKYNRSICSVKRRFYGFKKNYWGRGALGREGDTSTTQSRSLFCFLIPFSLPPRRPPPPPLQGEGERERERCYCSHPVNMVNFFRDGYTSTTTSCGTGTHIHNKEIWFFKKIIFVRRNPCGDDIFLPHHTHKRLWLKTFFFFNEKKKKDVSNAWPHRKPDAVRNRRKQPHRFLSFFVIGLAPPSRVHMLCDARFFNCVSLA